VAVIGGEAQLFSSPINAAMGQIKAGKLRPIAMTTAKRSAVLPDLPTIAESGFPGFDIGTWFGLLLPAQAAPALVTRMHAEYTGALKAPDVQERLLADGTVPIGSTPELVLALGWGLTALTVFLDLTFDHRLPTWAIAATSFLRRWRSWLSPPVV
jgi:tripartite-type tricarboxylate transporter receptor subunit TctC